MFDQFQTIVMRKILRIFKTTSIEIMKIECNLMPSNLQLLRKMQKYAVKIAKTRHLNNFNKYIPYSFSQNTEHQGLDPAIWGNKYAKWNEIAITKKSHPSQLYSILHSAKDFMIKNINLEKCNFQKH